MPVTCSALHGHYCRRTCEITVECEKVKGPDGAEYWRISSEPARGGLIPAKPVACDELGPGMLSNKFANDNEAMKRRLSKAANLKDVAATYGAVAVVYDAVFFWEGLYVFRIENGGAKGAFVQVDLDDLVGVDEHVLDCAFSNFILYSVFGDAWKWQVFLLGVGSAAAPATSDVGNPSLDVRESIPGGARPCRDGWKTDEGGPAPRPTTSTNDDERAPRRVRRADGTIWFCDEENHCLQGAVLNALRGYPHFQDKLASTFFDKQQRRMLHFQVGPWLADECGQVKIREISNIRSFSDLYDFLRRDGADGEYILSLVLADRAPHAISLDCVRGLIYDSAGGEYNDASLVDGLCRLEKSGAEIVYAAKLMVAEPGGSQKAKRKRKRSAQKK